MPALSFKAGSHCIAVDPLLPMEDLADSRDLRSLIRRSESFQTFAVLLRQTVL